MLYVGPECAHCSMGGKRKAPPDKSSEKENGMNLRELKSRLKEATDTYRRDVPKAV